MAKCLSGFWLGIYILWSEKEQQQQFNSCMNISSNVMNEGFLCIFIFDKLLVVGWMPIFSIVANVRASDSVLTAK